MTPGPGIEPGTHWWKASAITTAPTLLPLSLPCEGRLKDKLQRFQSRAARALTGTNYNICTADIIQTLSWHTLDARRLRAKSTLMYKILNDDTAPKLRNSFLEGMLIRLITKNNEIKNSATDLTLPKGRTIRKVMACVGKKQKKFSQGKMPRKKN